MGVKTAALTVADVVPVLAGAVVYVLRDAVVAVVAIGSVMLKKRLLNDSEVSPGLYMARKKTHPLLVVCEW